MSVDILLVDDHRMLREGLRAMLEDEPEIRVVGEAADGRSAVALTHRLRPDVVVMDVGMGELNGVDATRKIRHDHPEVKVVALSAYRDSDRVQDMLDAGACGYVVKSAAYRELRQAIEAATQGEVFLSLREAETGSKAKRRPPRGGADQKGVLSLREREVVQLIAEGHTSPEIAERLSISAATVDTHRRNIGRKLGYRSVADVTKYAVRNGLTPVES